MTDERDASATDGVADRRRLTRRIHQRVRPAELPQVVQIGVADERLAMAPCPCRGAGVEVRAPHPEIAPFDGVEQLGVTIEIRTETARAREEGVRSDDEPVPARAQPRHVVERARRLGGGGGKVQKQYVPARDRALDPRHEHDAAIAGIRRERGIDELPFVQGERQRVEAGVHGAIDECRGAVFDDVDGIFAGVKVKVDFEHVSTLNGAPAPLWGRPFRAIATNVPDYQRGSRRPLPLPPPPPYPPPPPPAKPPVRSGRGRASLTVRFRPPRL